MDCDKYSDIINLPHYVSEKHPKMSNYDRAAQFSPFAALTGHGEAISETSRITEEKRDLCEEEKIIISEKLRYICEIKEDISDVIFEYFVPDERKTGGTYVKRNCKIKKIDELNKRVILMDGDYIDIENIMDVDGDVFNTIQFI